MLAVNHLAKLVSTHSGEVSPSFGWTTCRALTVIRQTHRREPYSHFQHESVPHKAHASEVEDQSMRLGKTLLPAFVLGVGLLLTGCAGDSSSGTRNRANDTGKTADHTGAMNGTGGTSGAMSGTGGTGTRTGSGQHGAATTDSGNSDLDRRNRTGTETGMSSGSGSTTGGGTSLNGTERGNNPNRSNR